MVLPPCSGLRLPYHHAGTGSEVKTSLGKFPMRFFLTRFNAANHCGNSERSRGAFYFLLKKPAQTREKSHLSSFFAFGMVCAKHSGAYAESARFCCSNSSVSGMVPETLVLFLFLSSLCTNCAPDTSVARFMQGDDQTGATGCYRLMVSPS